MSPALIYLISALTGAFVGGSVYLIRAGVKTEDKWTYDLTDAIVMISCVVAALIVALMPTMSATFAA